MAVNTELLDAVRDYLDIPAEDNTGDAKLAGIIARGTKHLDDVAGETLDYSAEDAPRQLLFDFCRYVRASASEDFDKNFQSDLIALQMKYEAKRYGAAHE
jgi:hypothetical protein